MLRRDATEAEPTTDPPGRPYAELDRPAARHPAIEPASGRTRCISSCRAVRQPAPRVAPAKCDVAAAGRSDRASAAGATGGHGAPPERRRAL